MSKERSSKVTDAHETLFFILTHIWCSCMDIFINKHVLPTSLKNYKIVEQNQDKVFILKETVIQTADNIYK